MDTFSTASLNSWDLRPQRPWMSQRSEHESSSWILWLNNLTSMAFCSNYLQLSKDNNHQMEKRWKKRYKNSIFTQPPAPRPPSSLTWTPNAPRRNQQQSALYSSWLAVRFRSTPQPLSCRIGSIWVSAPDDPSFRSLEETSENWGLTMAKYQVPPPFQRLVWKKQREILFWRLFSRFILQGTIWFVDFNGWSISDVYVFSHARHPLHKKHRDFSINWI